MQRFIPPSIQSIMDPAVEYGFKHIFSLKENKPRPPSAPAQRSERLSSQNLGHPLFLVRKDSLHVHVPPLQDPLEENTLLGREWEGTTRGTTSSS